MSETVTDRAGLGINDSRGMRAATVLPTWRSEVSSTAMR